ncbi:helix-turn-helix domain-containing protein [Aquipseudomonas guryensis]|uniref:Helix-turn-helix domain-containing protein n=1 Tax=Aquipseudomonas guryensis TaxID=2759165 RepID=A0A7W4DD40_9GAMM|nr:helix-turn-helix domain-containing protein [Pseudomonas guryensis]MBB1520396.1 helix-turn-helix domain-containing protein [Pseudomonas guryensis]
MSRLVCADFDEFEEALYGVEGHYVLRSRQQRDWRLRVVELDGVALMFGREGAGTVYSGIGLPGFFNIFLPLSRHECTVLGGQRLNPRLIGWMVPEAMFHIDASQPASWMTVAMSCELVLRWMQQHEDEFSPEILTHNVVCLAQQDLAPLVWLALRLLRIDHCAPQQLHTPAAENSARNELLDSLFRSLLPATPVQRSVAAQHSHPQILRRALELLDAMPDTPLHMADLCQACNTSERTLRNLFTRYLGMSPHRYLMQHRLHAIRRALLHAGPEETITELCARFGVWDFGRFAGLYRRYFGELPSQSLRSRRSLPPLNPH